MLSIGIDAVEINRFLNWKKFNKKQLLKIFSNQEIDYCLKLEIKSAEKFASHFAAKEACYKAISPLLEQHVHLLYFLKNIELIRDNKTGQPSIVINLQKFILLKNIEIKKVFLTLTHSNNIAIAVVIIS